jgi:nitroimidazol reductase NimA-like FMN-containing flavoprotein (pyridoxamine 5'-phosphate oxidase superfamily)
MTFARLDGHTGMNVPAATALDERYSDPAAVASTWEQTCKVLQDAELFWISTVRADGRPHVTPVVAVWHGDALWFTTGADEQKYANLRANPHVVLTTGCNSWDGGLDVVVEGRASHVTDEERLRGVATAFTAKWAGRWHFTVRDGSFRHTDTGGMSEVFEVVPLRAFAHAKGDPFGATTHRF